MRRLLLTAINSVFILCLLILSQCTGGAIEESTLTGEEAGVEAEAGTDTVEDIAMLRLTHPDFDEGDGESLYPGCRSLEYPVDSSGNRKICFNPLNNEKHNVTIWDGETPLVRVIAGAQCKELEIPAGVYELRVCHSGGDDSSLEDLIFVAEADIATPIADEEESDLESEEESSIDYGDESVSNEPRFYSASSVTIFLATNTCVRCNLSGYDFSTSNFTSAILTGSNLTDANLSSVNFTNANLSRVRMDRANLNSANLTGATLTNASLKNASLVSANLTNINLAGSILRYSEMGSANFTNGTLTRVRFSDGDLENADFDDADVTRSFFENANLTNASFNDTDCSYAKFGNAELEDADFDGANLTQTFFNYANMVDTILTDTTQARTRFISADLSGADFTDAVQTDPIFSNAILDGATWINGLTCTTPSTSECDL